MIEGFDLKLSYERCPISLKHTGPFSFLNIVENSCPVQVLLIYIWLLSR